MKLTITKAEGIWTVRAGGAVLVESKSALFVQDGDQSPVTYFPRGDVPMEFFDAAQTAENPHLGTIQYFSIVTKSTTIENAAWSITAPKGDAEAIKDYVAFYKSDKVTIEMI